MRETRIKRRPLENSWATEKMAKKNHNLRCAVGCRAKIMNQTRKVGIFMSMHKEVIVEIIFLRIVQVLSFKRTTIWLERDYIMPKTISTEQIIPKVLIDMLGWLTQIILLNE